MRLPAHPPAPEPTPEAHLVEQIPTLLEQVLWMLARFFGTLAFWS